MIVDFIMEDPLYDSEHDEEKYIQLKVPQNSRAERALTHMCVVLGLDCYIISGDTK